MRTLRGRAKRDERGASLVLAIAFLVVAGAIGASLTASVTSGINDATALALARNRDYAAEGAINYAIVDVRATNPASSIGLAACGPFFKTLPLRGSETIDIRVDCYPAPELTTDLAARNNVIFVACDAATSGAQPCDTSSGSPPKVLAPAIIRAEINFQVSGTMTPTVTRTHVQTWSVKG